MWLVSILPWHKDFFLGDTAQTLDHKYQEILEHEANYGASELMFCGQVFRNECLDFDVNFKTIKGLQTRYENSLVTTARKLIRSQDEVCCFLAKTIPPWFAEDLLPGTLKSLEVSSSFEKQFSKKVGESLLSQINPQVVFRKGGPVGEFTTIVTDLNSDCFEFEYETFFNTHEIMTMGIFSKQSTGPLIIDF